MKLIFALTALVLTSAAFAAETEQVRGEVVGFKSMSELAADRNMKQYMNMLVSDCKTLRNDDAQCDVTGTEPIIATIHLTFGMEGPTIIPAETNVQKGDFVTSQSYANNKAPRIIEVLNKTECRWAGRLLNLGGQQIECSNDDAQGWEQGTAIMVRYPLKHKDVVAQQ